MSGSRGRKRLGQKKWEQAVKDRNSRLIAALEPEDVVLGGGNVKKLKKLPPVAGRATTAMHSWEDFAFGRKPIEGIALNPTEQSSRATRKPGR
jgi:polyphosphate glucokinase